MFFSATSRIVGLDRLFPQIHEVYGETSPEAERKRRNRIASRSTLGHVDRPALRIAVGCHGKRCGQSGLQARAAVTLPAELEQDCGGRRFPSFNVLMVDGEGDPNASSIYQEAVEALFSVSYKAKFDIRKRTGTDYAVMPLEGVAARRRPVDFRAAREGKREMDHDLHAALHRHRKRCRGRSWHCTMQEDAQLFGETAVWGFRRGSLRTDPARRSLFRRRSHHRAPSWVHSSTRRIARKASRDLSKRHSPSIT